MTWQPMMWTSLVLIVIGLLPGMPLIIFLVMAVAVLIAAMVLRARQRTEHACGGAEKQESERPYIFISQGQVLQNSEPLPPIALRFSARAKQLRCAVAALPFLVTVLFLVDPRNNALGNTILMALVPFLLGVVLLRGTLRGAGEMDIGQLGFQYRTNSGEIFVTWQDLQRLEIFKPFGIDWFASLRIHVSVDHTRRTLVAALLMEPAELAALFARYASAAGRQIKRSD